MTRNLIRLHAKKTAQQNINEYQQFSRLDCDVYNDRITPEQWQELFGESDDEEEFHGF